MMEHDKMEDLISTRYCVFVDKHRGTSIYDRLKHIKFFEALPAYGEEHFKNPADTQNYLSYVLNDCEIMAN